MVSDAFLNFFIVFHQVHSPSPHSYFLHFPWLNCFLILLQHMNHPHFNCVLLRSVLAICLVVCSHSIMRLIHHSSHTVHYWVLALAQHLIGISAFLEPPVSVWIISRTLWKSPSLSLSLLPILECANHLATWHQWPGRTFVYQLPLPSHYNTIIISVFICCSSCFCIFISCA